ncbi:MAG: ATP-binding protein [Chloroflexota bacterium]
MVTAAEALRAAPLFADLPDAELERLASLCEPVRLEAGDLLLREGEPGDALYVIVEGEIDVVRGSGADEVALARVGPGSVQGEMALLEGRPRNATARALTQVDALRIPGTAMLDLLATRPEASLAIVRTTLGRLRSTEALLAQRERLASLGTLAAGLAHELNNPAAAIRRSVVGLSADLAARTAAAEELAAADAPRLAALVAARPASNEAPRDALDRSDRAEAIGERLRALGAGHTDEAAAALVDAGWQDDELAAVLAPYADGPVEAAVGWLASVAGAEALLAEVHLAAERMGEIVRAVKGYAYLDQAPVQRVDLRAGLEDTLVILRHRLREIEVRRTFASDLPTIEAHGGELNQVWTNLIDNAVDAMDGRGTLDIGLQADGSGVRVSICDDGPGIPVELVPRLFEPFVTTKAPGVGTGLGLHISHQVVARHGGRLEVASRPGSTCFTVTLPGVQPQRQPPVTTGSESPPSSPISS